MAFTVTKTWSTGEGVTSTDLNSNFTDIEDVINGTTDNLIPNNAKLFAWIVGGL